MIFESNKYPVDPGCYQMKNKSGKVIYVGKAKNLRRRLASYFQKNDHDKKTASLLVQVCSVEVIIVNNETEALILENNLIKHYKPSYNRKLMLDFSGFPHIMLTGEKFPRLLPYRRNCYNKLYEKSKLSSVKETQRLGPFLSNRFRDALLDLANDFFRLRTCERLTKTVCLRFHIGNCNGICDGKITAADYHKTVKQAVQFLTSRQTVQLVQLEKEMWQCSAKMEFERAKKIRDAIQLIKTVLQPQIVEQDLKHNEDVLFFGEKQVLVMNFIGGMLLHVTLYSLAKSQESANPVNQFLLEHYTKEAPDYLLINHQADYADLARALSQSSGHSVKIMQPKKGLQENLMRLCEKNYKYRVKTFETELA